MSQAEVTSSQDPPSAPSHGSEATPLNGASASKSTNSNVLAQHRANSANPEGQNTSLNLNDPQTRLLVEKMLVSLSHESAASEEKAPSAFSFWDSMAILRRRWFPMLIMFVATLAATAWRLKPGTPVYNATSTMLLPAPSRGGEDVGDILKTGVKSPLGLSLATKIALVTSPALIERALNRLDPKVKLRGWGDSKVTTATVMATSPVSPDLIDITVTAHDPEAAKALANLLIEVYADRTTELVRESYKDSLKLLNNQKVQSEKLLLAAKREFQDFKLKSGITVLTGLMEARASAVQRLEQEALSARMEAGARASSQTVQADSVVNDLQQKATLARARYEQIVRDLLPNAPEAVAARQQWQDSQEMLNRRIAALTQSAQNRASGIEAQLAQARREASSLPPLEFKYSQLEGKIKLLQNTYDALSDRYTRMNLDQIRPVDLPTVLNQANRAVPIGRTWTNALITALLCAFVLAAVVGILLEQLDNTVHSADDLESAVGATVLGSLPMLGHFAARRLPQKENNAPALLPPVNTPTPDSNKSTAHGDDANATPFDTWQRGNAGSSLASSQMLLEAFRIVRTNLVFSTVDAPLRSLLLTSADAGEGKSFCALNLATVMAYDGKRVILLDCDLRRPTQHILAGVARQPGYTNAVVGGATIEECLQPSGVENLLIMTAGPVPPNPPELLGSAHGRRLLEELKGRCDILIIDSPPVLSLSDAQVLSSIADGVLVVVSAGGTPVRHIQRAQYNIRHAGGRLLGVVLNKAKRYNDPYYTYTGYYGSGYGSEEKTEA